MSVLHPPRWEDLQRAGDESEVRGGGCYPPKIQEKERKRSEYNSLKMDGGINHTEE